MKVRPLTATVNGTVIGPTSTMTVRTLPAGTVMDGTGIGAATAGAAALAAGAGAGAAAANGAAGPGRTTAGAAAGRTAGRRPAGLDGFPRFFRAIRQPARR